MKKNFTLLSAIFLLLFSLNVKAQDEDKPVAKSYMSFIGGLSWPNGSFGSTNYSDNASGFAKRGTTFGLDFGVYLYKNLALGILASYQDQGELSAVDAQNLANGYNSSFFKDQTSVTTLGRYTNFNLMVGPQYTFLYKKFALDLRADAGLLKNLTSPTLQIIFDYSSNSGQTYNQLSSGSLTFAYGGSAGLRYSLSDSWDVGLKFIYVDSNGIKIENTGGDAGTVGRFQTHLPISETQATLGITLKF
jgi:opacity protein-like surface antigen